MKTIIALLFAALSLAMQAQKKPKAKFSENQIKKHVDFLASDELKGRGTGTQEELKAANYIASHFRKLDLIPKGNLSSYLYSFSFKKRASVHDTVGTGPVVQGLNVVAFLDNKAEHTIVIGAHYDHLGLGHDLNSREPDPEGKIHNGADDNASGVAGVIELARFLKTNQVKENYNFLFICFSGEELGLMGSKRYCENPTIDLSKVNCMINLDMIGRMNDTTEKVMVFGVGTAPDFVAMLDRQKGHLTITKDSSGIGPSDQTSFYLKNIPVLHFFTGQHSDYHKPSDDADKVNHEGVVMILEYIVRTLDEINALPRLVFLKTRNNTGGGKTSFKVTMGIMPDYTFEGKGVKIDGVTEGKPAASAGITIGDIIIRLGDIPVNHMQDYMKALGTFNKGQKVKVVLIRNNAEIEKEITF
ncbi:MAG: M20/M25/M40 family metallo-hydrolase [Bacteroidia bacterium]|nr:M20/M25/M40 family metallo-hydrolase [Bacteroidia bacterium]